MSGEQLDLLAHGLARASDHTSSHDAARRAVASGLVATHEERILEVLRREGCALTLEQLAQHTGLSTVQVARRMGGAREASSVGLVGRGLARVIRVPGERLRWYAVPTGSLW